MKFMYLFDNRIKKYIMYGKRMFHPQETGRYDAGISCIVEDDVKVWFYTKNNVTIAVDAGYLNYAGVGEEMKKETI